ncbi:PQQ-dependent sugar dehydrogenase [Sphingomonas desiccabilis]|uniref:Sorbosone dehydrogenase family protein n=1 Tax=Sphingomonas desiccabilis TaxID=429134 RepID=A0A4Q2IQX0_9SPHN|nr:sorbosone dehydrogenase family protein [Sphingomonas desiccabilis]MBB3912503.1 glucose/arabinose dehydrogenase [Sphingomonas desiccabilis]RXZ30612.1 sorbosone dehydrogenase family protein [Sphingomonas desiccabilis]
MRKHLLRLAAVFLVLLLALGWWLFSPDRAKLPEDAVTGAQPQLSRAREQTIPTVRIAKPIGWTGDAMPTPAQGLRVQPFARGLDHPRWLYRLANGDVLVAESNSPPREGGGLKGWVMKLFMGRAGAGVPSANRITLLRDADGDGVAEQRSALLTGLNSPFGMAVVGDWLYVANTDALVRFPFQVGQTRITANAEKVVDLPGGGNHWTRNVVANPEGKTLFVTVGSASNIAEDGLEVEKNRAAILEVDPLVKKFRIYASGLRNPNGMAFEPNSRALWTVVNERDMIGSDMPPDYMTRVEFGGFYGWPWHYWGGYVDDRVQPQRPDLREYTARPDYALGAHTASLGLAFAGDAKLGPRFASGAFIGQHGSWNRVPPSGYKVVFVPFAANGFPVKGAKPVDVLSGFLDQDGKARGRPVGVITDRSGGLLVADDVGNVIWRVSAAAGR